MLKKELLLLDGSGFGSFSGKLGAEGGGMVGMGGAGIMENGNVTGELTNSASFEKENVLLEDQDNRCGSANVLVVRDLRD